VTAAVLERALLAPAVRSFPCAFFETRVTNASPKMSARKNTAAEAAGRALRMVVKNVGMA
jgi:hypothetical protein